MILSDYSVLTYSYDYETETPETKKYRKLRHEAIEKYDGKFCSTLFKGCLNFA